MRRLLVRFDFDNTMVGLTQGIVDFHNRRNPEHRQLTMADHTSYDAMPCPCWKDTVRAFYQCEGFFVAHVQPYPLALDVVERAARVHDVEIVSAYLRDDTTPRKREVLRQHRSSLAPLLRGVKVKRGRPHQRGRDVVDLPRSKYDAADVIVEDAPAQLMTERNTHPGAVIIAIDHPYNRISAVRSDARVYGVATTGWRAVEAIILATATRS